MYPALTNPSSLPGTSSWQVAVLDDDDGDELFADILSPDETVELEPIRHHRRRLQAKAARCAAKYLWLHGQDSAVARVTFVRQMAAELQRCLRRARSVEIRYRRKHAADRCPVLHDHETANEFPRQYLSLAHCGRFVLAAIATHGPIGCDAEEIAGRAALFESCHSPAERAWLARDASPASVQLAATRLWTIKEAWYKQHCAAHADWQLPFCPQAIEVDMARSAHKAWIRHRSACSADWAHLREFVYQNCVFTLLGTEVLL
jgi:hypothetical protein